MTKKLYVRILGSAAGAILVTFSLFYLMQYLIAMAEAKTNKTVGGRIPDFIHLRRDENRTNTKDRELPQKAPKAPEPPPTVASTPSNAGANTFAIAIAPPTSDKVEIAGPDWSGAVRDSDVIPMVRITPIYPRGAAQRGINGWVIVQFTITETGTVRDERVISARPPNVFDQSALAAIRKWKYKPKLIDRKPVPMRGIRKRFTFQLDSD